MWLWLWVSVSVCQFLCELDTKKQKSGGGIFPTETLVDFKYESTTNVWTVARVMM